METFYIDTVMLDIISNLFYNQIELLKLEHKSECVYWKKKDEMIDVYTLVKLAIKRRTWHEKEIVCP